MGSRNRNLSEQRDDFLLETNFDDDGALTRAHYSNNRISSNHNTAETRPRAYRSNYSIDRYSDAAKSYREGQQKVICSLKITKRTRTFVMLIRSTKLIEKLARIVIWKSFHVIVVVAFNYVSLKVNA
jgi:hypothetical protein